ncbi:hypothetical protein B0T14DRAFT_425921 [Immersiella caudata]|uniref:Rhodopsin domain-containing protein n=1 Tax=Immersiella caudata TaxID=314043 RepID=A0AA39WY94_9PEZI|nr:hypothetical protein B0T14DRAFT_425921 [Immersiella caudata]
MGFTAVARQLLNNTLPNGPTGGILSSVPLTTPLPGAPPGASPPGTPQQPGLPPGIIPLTPAQLAALPHDDAGPHLVRTIWILIGISLVFLLLRLYAKFFRHRGLWWDDYILIGAWLCITTESCMLTYATTLGYGKHIYDIPFDIVNIEKTVMAISIGGTLSLTAAIWSKTSFALTLLRLTDGWLKNFIWFCIITTNIAMGLSALFVWVTCRPLEKAWHPFMAGTCWAPETIVQYNIFSAAYSALMDLTLALLPWKLIWGLQMKRKEKIGVAVAMSCGIFAGITAIIKTTHIPKMISMDSYDGIVLFIWGNAESCVTIIAASIPILRVFAKEIKTTTMRYYTAGGDNYGAGTKRTRNNTVVVTATRSRTGREKQDDWSDKSILDNQNSPAGKIMHTSEVVVDYRTRQSDEKDFEMHRLP